MKKLAALFLSALLLLTGCTTQQTAEATVHAVSGDALIVHYIDVGQADCALLENGGEFMLIDGGNVADGSLVVSYLEQMGVEELKAVICTHAHEDHVGGLASVLAVYPTETVYAPTKTYSSRCFDDFLYYVDQQGLEVTIPEPGDQFSLGEAEVSILGPVKSYPETNNTSIVAKVVYGSTSFLFTGDMEKEAEADLLDYGMDVSADVLKVGHHGSNTSTTYRFLKEVDPTYGVISCGKDNSYGHPHEEPMSRLRQAGVVLFRTDEMGTVVAVSDGSQIQFTWANQNAAPEQAEPAQETEYIGNRKSQIYHTPDCRNLPKEENRVTFASIEDAQAAGFTPCKNCLGGK